MFDGDELIGAINLLIDVTDQQATALSGQADRCRRLALATCDPSAGRILEQMATEYAATATALRG